MDFETFGEHQWRETGIFDFMEYVPRALLAGGRVRFETPRQVAQAQDAVARLDVPYPVSWADAERDLTAWLGNQMQRAAHDALYKILPEVKRAAELGRTELLERWRKLSTSDHVYYMCTKWFADGDVHKYFSPYSSPHDAFITFMNVLDDLARRTQRAIASAPAVSPGPPAPPAGELPLVPRLESAVLERKNI
jgi:alpha-amylase